MDLELKIINFIQQQKPGFAQVLKEQGNKLQVVDLFGKNLRLARKDVINIFPGGASRAEGPGVMAKLHEEVLARKEEVDTELLWQELLSSAKDTFSFEDVTLIYYNELTPLLCATVIWALCEDAIHFRLRGQSVFPVPEEHVEQIERQRIIEQSRELWEKKLRKWISSLEFQGEIADVPEDFQHFIQQVEAMFSLGHTNDAWQMLEKLAGEETTPEKIAFDLLVKTGKISPGSDAILQLAGIARTYPEELMRYLEEAFSPSPYPQENSSRWADSIAFSIDDADTREIDDAITISADGNCLEVGIHIADLSHFVKPNDPVDQVALRRCATMYLPTGPIFMIPPQISCEIASLNPEEPRPVLSLLVRFETNGRILNWEFTRGTLRTQRRLNYEEVDAIITNPQSNPWGPQIKRLHKICQALQRNRLRNGAMIFDKQEMKLRIDDDIITPKVFPTISPARNLVAELMILYNHLAAEFARRNRIPVIYRAQDKPDEPASRFVGKIIRETYPSAFRGLKKGRLTLKPQPHSGLGLRSYTQVSSPLRRFADLVMQRQLIAYLENMKYPYEPSNLLEVLNNAEIIEREHREIERRCTRYWELEFIRRQGIDREYEAVVMNKLPASYIVALQPWPVRGLLKSQELYKFGATVKVKIAALNPNLEVLRLVPVKESAGD